MELSRVEWEGKGGEGSPLRAAVRSKEAQYAAREQRSRWAEQSRRGPDSQLRGERGGSPARNMEGAERTSRVTEGNHSNKMQQGRDAQRKVGREGSEERGRAGAQERKRAARARLLSGQWAARSRAERSIRPTPEKRTGKLEWARKGAHQSQLKATKGAERNGKMQFAWTTRRSQKRAYSMRTHRGT